MINNPHNDPYKGAEDLISSLKADIESYEKDRDEDHEGDREREYFRSGQIRATLQAIRGIEVYVLLTKKFQ